MKPDREFWRQAWDVFLGRDQIIRDRETARKHAECVRVLRALHREYDNHPCPDPVLRHMLWEDAGRVLAELDKEEKP